MQISFTLEQERHCSGHVTTPEDATRKKLHADIECMPLLKMLHVASANTLCGTA